MNWDSLPPDIQERVLTAVANDRPYLNAVQNSDAQNAGIELDAALQRAIRDTLVELIRENPPASAALSETAAELKTDRELRDRLAAQVDGMMSASDDTATLLAQAEQDPAYLSARARGLMERYTPEERAALDRKWELSKRLRREQYEAEFPTSERQALIDEMRALGVSERMIGWYDEPTQQTGQGNAEVDRSRMQDIIDRERAEQASLPVTVIPPHVAAEIARGIADAARNYDNQATIEAQARERMPASRRYSKAPSLRKAEREQMKRLTEEVDELVERQDALVAQHGITDADMEILRDHANPLGRHLEHPHLRAKWRNEFYDVAPYEGVREATKRANAEIARYQAQGGLEAEERQKREQEEERQRRIADNRAKSEQQLAWVRQKIAAGETVGIYAMTYTGGLGGMKPSGPEITPKLYANWQASGEALFRIGADGDLLVATGRKRDPYHSTTFSTLASSDGQRFSESDLETRLEGRDSVKDGVPVQVIERVPVDNATRWVHLSADMIPDRSLPDSDRRKIDEMIEILQRNMSADDPDYIDPATVKAMSNAQRLKVAKAFMERRQQTAPPPPAETWSGTATAEPPAVRLWVGRALTQGAIPVVLTVRAAEPGDEARFVLSGQDLFQDLGGVYTSVVPLQDVQPTDARPLTAQDAEVLLLDKSPVLVTPGVIPVGSPVKFPTGERINYGHVQGGPGDRRTFRIEKPRRSQRAKAGRVASAR